MHTNCRHGGLELREDLREQLWSWHLQRVARWLMALVVLAGALGLAGDGPLDRGRSGAGDASLRLEYGRRLRRDAPAVLRVVAQAQPGMAEVRVAIARSWLERVRVDAVLPPAQRVEAAAAHQTWIFPLAGAGGPVVLRFHYRPLHAGALNGWIRRDGAAPAALSQYVLP
ncbi:MAG: hypothetical protein EYC70_04765 [Planctomycetota bacterium]|nr:MAG: hypothetical protein EYC70_04765 [Planctomycetota bacterium]